MPLIRLGGQFGSTVRRTSSARSDASLRQECAWFLESLFRTGAFPGRAPDEAYFVRCGRDTMTGDDIDNGRLTILIGIAPLRPAEFVGDVEAGEWARPSGCRRRVYSLDPESGRLTFGDGKHGALVPAGSQNVRVAYRHGAGTN